VRGKAGRVAGYYSDRLATVEKVLDNLFSDISCWLLNAGLVPGMIGVYEVQLQLSSSLPTNPNTQLFIAQNVFTSNIVTLPVVAPQ
jgi:hypothetical protein